MSQKRILRRMLLSYSSEDDIKTYCFDLGISYEALGDTNGLNEKIRSLINYICQRKLQGKFRQYLLDERPEISWDAVEWTRLCNSHIDQDRYLYNSLVTIKFEADLATFDRKIISDLLIKELNVDPKSIAISAERDGSVIVDLIFPKIMILPTLSNDIYLTFDIDLSYTNLQEANLKEARLEEANFLGARLYKANLQNAKLEGANLEGVDLQRANLQGAEMMGANLKGANLKRAKLGSNFSLSSVIFDETTIWPWGKNLNRALAIG